MNMPACRSPIGCILPKEWAEDVERRKKARVPEEIKFKTKPQIALDQLRAACAAGVPRGVVLDVSSYGSNSELRAGGTALASDAGSTQLAMKGTSNLVRASEGYDSASAKSIRIAACCSVVRKGDGIDRRGISTGIATGARRPWLASKTGRNTCHTRRHPAAASFRTRFIRRVLADHL